ncbi:MAG TPA: hypothetical protein VNV85_07135 [Puia sp.]|jgi:hypothetical protein|nr:hypothetical protein [Puia sp.]
MKRVILSLIFIPFAGKAGFNSALTSSTVLVEVRSGDWPISLEKTSDKPGESYFLQFRDQQVMTNVVLDTLPFPDLAQLKYFEKALSVLKKGNNGDIAKFKDYSVKRAESKKEGKWYILRYQWGLTNFQQAEADTLINTIRRL